MSVDYFKDTLKMYPWILVLKSKNLITKLVPDVGVYGQAIITAT